MTFVRLANYLMRAASMSHILEMWHILLMKLPQGKGERCWKQESLVYIFPFLRYYSLFVGRCLIGRGDSGGLSAPDLAILRHALLRDRTFSLGAMVARLSSLNRTKGPIFGGIYASRLARCFEIPIRHDEKEEMLLPTSYLDYNSMVAHDFIRYDKEKRLIYNLVFSEKTCQIITCLHLLCLIYIQAGTLLCPMAYMHTRGLTQPPAPEPYLEPVHQWEPQELSNQWNSQEPPHSTVHPALHGVVLFILPSTGSCSSSPNRLERSGSCSQIGRAHV